MHAPNARKLLLAVMLTAVLAVTALPQGAAATDIVRFRGQSAFAFFESVDGSGCIVTTVAVGGYLTQTRQDAASTDTSNAYVYLERYDTCTGTTLLFAEGLPTPAQIAIDNHLTSGSIAATIDAYDHVSGVTKSVDVDVAWTGTGDLVDATDRYKENGPGYKVIFSSKGAGRDATATGSVSEGTTEYIQGSSTFARLNESKGGQVVISS
jgi:hypothetical protein